MVCEQTVQSHAQLQSALDRLGRLVTQRDCIERSAWISEAERNVHTVLSTFRQLGMDILTLDSSDVQPGVSLRLDELKVSYKEQILALRDLSRQLKRGKEADLPRLAEEIGACLAREKQIAQLRNSLVFAMFWDDIGGEG